MNPPPPPAATPRVGISACLLGHEVRWDGGHKRDALLTDDLGRLFEWVAVCPEQEMGLGVPRPPLRLEGDPRAPRLVFKDSRADITDRMTAWAREGAARLVRLDLCGFVLKSGSPSCGMARVEVHGPGGGAVEEGTGIFARLLMDRLPLLPIEEESRLRDPRLRADFIDRVFACRRRHAPVPPGGEPS